MTNRNNHQTAEWLMAMIATAVVAGSGCRAMHPFRLPVENAPVIFNAAPDQSALVQAINGQTQAVLQLSCDVHVRMEGVPPLSGTLIVEKPRRLRLKAGLVGISEMGVDVGSNDDEFWIWNKSSVGGQAPTIYFAKHAEFAQSDLCRQIPFEPQWIIDALGMIYLPDDGSLQGPTTRADGRLELRQSVATSAGYTTKLYVIDSQTGLVKQLSVYDANSRLIAYANAVQHQYFEEFHVALPRRIELVVFGPDNQPTSLNIDLAGHRINQLYGDPQMQWAMPRPADVQWVDLARMSIGG